MARTFSRTLRSLESDRSRRSLVGLAVAVALLAAWVGWFFGARLAVYAVSRAARLEVAGAARPVEAPVAGRLAEARAELGQSVAAGEVLFVLDPQALAEEATAARERLAALAERRAALADEIDRAATALAAEQGRAGSARAEAEARAREAAAAARQAEAELVRVERLAEAGLAAEADVERARAQAQQRQAAAEALRLAVGRGEAESRATLADRRAEADRLRQQAAALDEEIAAARAGRAGAEQALAERAVRAPVAGRVGELAAVPPGSVVAAGERLAVIVPPGEAATAVAWFPAAEALGRIRPGQHGRLRLEGFPATEFGTLPARVTGVASQARADGLVRVELALAGDTPPPVPVEHGLPAVAEVVVERASPATLLLRAAGRRAVAAESRSGPAPAGTGPPAGEPAADARPPGGAP